MDKHAPKTRFTRAKNGTRLHRKSKTEAEDSSTQGTQSLTYKHYRIVKTKLPHAIERVQELKKHTLLWG